MVPDRDKSVDEDRLRSRGKQSRMVRASFGSAYLEKGPGEPYFAFPRLMVARVYVYSHRVSTACRVSAGMSDDGMMHSDHRPVFVDFDI